MYILATIIGFSVIVLNGWPFGAVAWLWTLLALMTWEHVTAPWAARFRAFPARLRVALIKWDVIVGGVAAGFLDLSQFGSHYLSAAQILAGIAAVAAGAILASVVYHVKALPQGLFPVTGRWQRRFLAGLAILLLQPICPSSLFVAALASLILNASPTSWALTAELVATTAVGSLWLLTLPLHYAPYYEALVRGRPNLSPPEGHQVRGGTDGSS